MSYLTRTRGRPLWSTPTTSGSPTVARHGLGAADATSGVDHAGHQDATTLAAAVRSLRSRVSSVAELGVHPGEGHDPERDRFGWGYQWEAELEALCAPELRSLIDRCGFALRSYRHIAPSYPPG